MSIYEKLFAIQQNLKAPKAQLNKFGGYHYRSCEDILEAVKQHTKACKCVVNLTDEMVEVGGRIYVKATAALTDTETGEKTAVCAFAREEESKKGMDASQVTGAASSYARKYALNGLFAIDDTKDSDATNLHDKKAEAKQPEQPAERRPQTTIGPDNAVSIEIAARKAGVEIEKLLAAYKVQCLADLTEQQFENCMKRLRKTEEKNTGERNV